MSSESVLRIFLETLLQEMRCGSMNLASASFVARRCEAISKDRDSLTVEALLACSAGYPRLIQAFDAAMKREMVPLDRYAYNKLV